MNRYVLLLGSTGSIGQSTLSVIRDNSDKFRLVGVSANRNVKLLKKQVFEFRPDYVALTGYTEGDDIAREFAESVSGKVKRVFMGHTSHLDMIREANADILVNGISGAAGLSASVETIKSKKNLALANKETVVLAGEYIKRLVLENGVDLIPVDSEHSAIFHLLRFIGRENVDEIILTASGGAFRDLSYDDLERVTVEDALSHPTWKMGTKITIDSATMANKGLEIMEAEQLFDFDLKRIKVIVHRESMVHSFVRTHDGVLYAQISNPDMKMPINNALNYPNVNRAEYGRLKLENLSLSFERVDSEKYRMVDLAYRASEMGNAYRIVYNAANEVAVEEFVSKRIGFMDIPNVVEVTLERDWSVDSFNLKDIWAVDRESRIIAREIIDKLESRI